MWWAQHSADWRRWEGFGVLRLRLYARARSVELGGAEMQAEGEKALGSSAQREHT